MNRNSNSQANHTSFDASAFYPPAHYFARLMSPPEVAEATRLQPLEVREKTKGHWVLSGDVAKPMFNLLKKAKRRDVAGRLTGFTSSEGFSYCVLTHQIERFQHRFLLSLSDPAVRKFLDSITTGGQVTFLLGNDEGDDSLLLENPLKPFSFLPVLSMAHPADLEAQRAAMQELPDVQDLTGRPLQIPSIFQQYPVRDVSVSMLLPTIITDLLNDALEKAVRA